MSHTGTCFCGSVKLEVSGAPEAMGYCHCRSCRSWSGGPVNAFSLWKPTPEAIRKAAERNSLPVERITEVRVLDPYFHM